MRKGALVMAVTRAHAIDMATLRERILADWRVADVIADDFARLLRGEAPQVALTAAALRVRTEVVPVPGT
jgi:hypothetical protein